MRVLVPLRPQGPVEVIDRATHLLRTRAGDVLGIGAMVQLPIWLVLALVFRDRWAEGLGDNGIWTLVAVLPDPTTLGLLADEELAGSPWAVLLARGLPSLGLAVMGAAYGVLVHDWSRGRRTTGGQALLAALRRLPALAGLWALVHVIEIGTCIGLVLGPLVFGVAMPLAGMERLGPLRGVRRSWALSSRRLGALLVTVPVATLVATVTAAVLGGVGTGVLALLADDWVDAGGAAAVALSAALPHLVLDPILALSMALLALDLKVQVEGYDLEVELAEVAERTGG